MPSSGSCSYVNALCLDINSDIMQRIKDTLNVMWGSITIGDDKKDQKNENKKEDKRDDQVSVLYTGYVEIVEDRLDC